MARGFPPGWLALAAAVLSISLFLLIIFGTFVRLKEFAGGLDPFDARPLGYTAEEARQLLAALGEEGRTYYDRVQLRIDTYYPASYWISRSLVLLWLSRPGRVAEQGFSMVFRSALIGVPFLVMIFDYGENSGVSKMLNTWPDLSEATVWWASKWSIAKTVSGAVVDIVMLGLLIIAAARWVKTRMAAR